MKKIIIFTILLGFFMPMGSSYAAELNIHSSPSWEELEVAADRAGIEISRERPISWEDYADILEEYVEVLEEKIREMGLVPVSSLKVTF